MNRREIMNKWNIWVRDIEENLLSYRIIDIFLTLIYIELVIGALNLFPGIWAVLIGITGYVLGRIHGRVRYVKK